jgi:protein-tyrosine phosphatase
LNENYEIALYVDDVAPPAGPQDLRAALSKSGIELLRFPIPDGGTPHSGHYAELRVLLGEVVDRLRAGRTVAVACRGGIGRTGTILGLLLIELGCTPAEAVQRVRDMKRECIDQGEQEKFVRAWKPTPGVS